MALPNTFDHWAGAHRACSVPPGTGTQPCTCGILSAKALDGNFSFWPSPSYPIWRPRAYLCPNTLSRKGKWYKFSSYRAKIKIILNYPYYGLNKKRQNRFCICLLQFHSRHCYKIYFIALLEEVGMRTVFLQACFKIWKQQQQKVLNIWDHCEVCQTWKIWKRKLYGPPEYLIPAL